MSNITDQKKPTFNNFNNKGYKKPNYNGSKPFTPYVSDILSHQVTRRFVFSTNAGGRIRRMNVITAVGNPKLHQIGMGSGTSANAQVAIKRAETSAITKLKNVKIRTIKNGTVKTVEQQMIHRAYGIILVIKPGSKPNNIIANNTIKKLSELVGINSLSVKIIGKAAIHNQASAFIEAITTMESARDVAQRLSMPIHKIIERNTSYYQGGK